ncbi:MAG: DUF1080 domain-containing protein [Proteobacteria bacterium]|nr:DUF1080 domain-containing protein [Pseudomonadota bacterium]
MLRRFLILSVVVVSVVVAHGAERVFDFAQMPEGKPPEGFFNVLTGIAKPGDWKVVPGDAPTAFKPLVPGAPATSKVNVLAQLSTDATDERFPTLIFDGDVYDNFTFTTKIKCVAGKAEQMAGVVFRYQDPKNYYYVRASALGNNVRFFKVVNGLRGDPIGTELPVPAGVWHELTVECKGNQIHFLFNGKEVVPTLTDNSFAFGKIGFWTKSDSVSQFTDAKIIYIPRETLAKAMVREIFEQRSSIVEVVIFMKDRTSSEVRVVACHGDKFVGQAGGQVEKDVIAKDVIYSGQDPSTGVMLVTMPLHDRNGEPVAAVRVELKAFKGQTDKNAILRATPLVKQMEQRFKEAKDLVE